jgi:DNA-binding SARP family transcriptional activator/tetratricopeptide (TPR) repeat protein
MVVLDCWSERLVGGGRAGSVVGVIAGGGDVQVRLLGPVDVLADGVSRPVPGLRRKAVLAVLALQHGEIVSTDHLVEAVWGGAPPPTAVNTVQSHVSHLRHILGGKAAVRARAPGYLLDLGAEGTDVEVAERLVRLAEQAPDLSQRLQHLQAATALWRGRPLADVTGLAWLGGQAERLDGLWLQATRALVETRLALGEHAQLVVELERLTGDHPFDEQIHGQFVLALYRAGRQADALAAYQRLRRTLGADLGIDPSQPLRDLEAAILRQDPALDPTPPAVTAAVTPAAAPVPAPRAVPVPAQLPPAVPAFTGRRAELAALDAALAGVPAAPGGQPPPVAVWAVSGTAGVGKTALAVHWAHRVAGQFPDGQLYVNLRGYDPERPVSAADALAGFLGELAVAGQDIPLDLANRAARYRTAIAGRRILVVLDNAASVEQVRPLLPGTPTAMVVVTSRDSLAGLVALHGARRLDLDLLPAPDALALLRGLIGGRVEAEPGAATELADQCARLPLALRVAAELAAARPATPLSDLVAELADQQQRLDLLDAGGDPRAAVTAVFSWSYRHLPADAAGVFRLAGLHPGPDLDGYAAAALAGSSLDQARRTLGLLARAHLVHPTGAGRYGMHDLLRAYATGLAGAQDTEPERRAAVDRLFDYYLSAAAAAMDQLHPAEAHRRPRIRPAATPVPAPADAAAARAWLDAERPNLVAAAVHATDHGWPAHTVRLSVILFRYLDGGHYTDGQTIHEYALRAARATGDRAGEAEAAQGLGGVHMQLGRHELAAASFEQALRLARKAGDRGGEARALNNLGVVHMLLCHYAPAVDHHQQALALHRELGDHGGEARTLICLGSLDRDQGRYDRAAGHLRRALTLFGRSGDQAGCAWALNSLGHVETQLGQFEPATEHHRQALALNRQLGNRAGEAWALTNFGDLHLRAGRPEEAARHHQQALAIFRTAGERYGEASALNGLGEAAHATGDPAGAHTRHTAALAIATNTSDEQARAHTGLGRAHQALGDHARARRHLRRALAVYTELGRPESAAVRADLTALDQPSRPAARITGARRQATVSTPPAPRTPGVAGRIPPARLPTGQPHDLGHTETPVPRRPHG